MADSTDRSSRSPRPRWGAPRAVAPPRYRLERLELFGIALLKETESPEPAVSTMRFQQSRWPTNRCAPRLPSPHQHQLLIRCPRPILRIRTEQTCGHSHAGHYTAGQSDRSNDPNFAEHVRATEANESGADPHDPELESQQSNFRPRRELPEFMAFFSRRETAISPGLHSNAIHTAAKFTEDRNDGCEATHFG